MGLVAVFREGFEAEIRGFLSEHGLRNVEDLGSQSDVSAAVERGRKVLLQLAAKLRRTHTEETRGRTDLPLARAQPLDDDSCAELELQTVEGGLLLRRRRSVLLLPARVEIEEALERIARDRDERVAPRARRERLGRIVEPGVPGALKPQDALDEASIDDRPTREVRRELDDISQLADVVLDPVERDE